MDPQQQFCLKWNSYSSNLAMTFSNLFKSELLADVTLFCGGTVFKAHKLILAACSKNFAELFETAPTNGSVVVILEATSSENMAALLEFMYKGEVHVSQEALNSFLKAAENLQVKGLSTEHGRLAAQQSQSQDTHMDTGSPGPQRRNQRSSSRGHSGSGNNGGAGASSSPTTPQHNTSSGSLSMSNLKQECEQINPNNSTHSGYSQYTMPPTLYRSQFEQPRKRQQRSPFQEQESSRQSVLRDGSKGSAESNSPLSKGYRPASSASSTAPTEIDTLQADRSSPQSRYDNHSPPSNAPGNASNASNDQTDHGELNVANAIKQEGSGNKATNSGAQDLRIKMEIYENAAPASTSSNASLPTATCLTSYTSKDDAGLASIAPADMLNVWNAQKMSSKGSGTVNTADGKKLKCLYCDRLYGYETNLRAHIRQRHQGIRVPCPFCSRTFTRNNTVRRHIAREHKHETSLNQLMAGGGAPQAAQTNHAA